MTWLLEDIMRMDFTEIIGSHYKIQKTAIFNKTTISEKEAWEKIESGEYDNRIIIMTKKQFENIFGKEA